MRGRLSNLSAALVATNPTLNADALAATAVAMRPVGPLRDAARIVRRKQGKTYTANGLREMARRQATGDVQ